jgi:hypothetical protein
MAGAAATGYVWHKSTIYAGDPEDIEPRYDYHGDVEEKASEKEDKEVGNSDEGRGSITFPDIPEEMDELLGQEGKRIPDGPATPGREKVKWKLPDGATVTYEQHPYHEQAPDYHTAPHYHVDIPRETPHQRFLPGDDIPFSK